MNPTTGKCLDVATAGTVNGALVRQWSCNGTVARQRQVNANGTITNPNSGKCPDAAGQGAANGPPAADLGLLWRRRQAAQPGQVAPTNEG